MRKRRAPFTILLMLIFLLTACTPRASQPPIPSASQAASSFENTHWLMVSFGPIGAEKPVVEGPSVTLLAADDKVGGSGGCNSYGGAYEITGDQLSFHNINSTLMACVDAQIMQQEQRYFEALQSAGTFEVKDNRLTITYDSGQGVLEFEMAVTPALQ
jgi:heat shock protein HslJ